MTPLQIVAFGLATGSGMAYLWVAINNWRVLIVRRFRPGARREAMVFLMGPVLTVLLVQGIRFAGAPFDGRTLSLIALAALVLDPAALPAFLVGLARWVQRRLAG